MRKKCILAVKAIGAAVVCLSLLFAGLALAEEPEGETEEEDAWQQAEIFLSLASAAPGNGSQIGEKIREESGGRIFCNTYWNGDMGNDTELTAAVQTGTISIVQCATSSQTWQIPELALLDIPYLFPTYQECDEKLKGKLMDFFQQYYNQAGVQLITWYCPALRMVTCSFPLETADDLKKLKIRLLDSKYHDIYWRAVGADTFNIPIANMFFALQQGLVNAQDSPPYVNKTAEFFELQNTLVMTHHVPYIGSVVMNKAVYDSLAPEDREMLTRVFADYYRSSGTVMTAEDYQQYYERVIVPDGELKEALLAGVPAVEEALRTELGDEVVDSFYKILNEDIN